ncbi:MAG: serine protease [Polyangiaceae bacterium]
MVSLARGWAFSFSGCGGPASKLGVQHSLATGCPQANITVKPIGGVQYLVSGCEEATIYRCFDSSGCIPESNQTTKGESAASVMVLARGSTGPNASQPRREKTKSGSVQIAADIELESHVTVHLAAEPGSSDKPMQVGLVLRDNERAMADCELGVLLNGERITLGTTQRQNKGTFVVLSTRPPQALVSEFGVAERVTFSACDRRFALDPAMLDKLHAFVTKYENEVAIQGDPKSGASSKLVAPAAGWPAWSVSTKTPSAVKDGKEFSATELYELLKPSVYRVDSFLGAGSAQGSAVAIGPTELLTNCHVVAGSRKIIVTNADHEYVARLVRSLPSADRCVLTVNGGDLTPVRGIRAYADLKIGETLYTLGTPSGLELSLSSGLLSGLRQEEPIGWMVQTTAPVSPGSSGGGLFDNRGNLVGITTLVLVGRRRLNQALNFAIAAEEFWLEAR